MTATDLAKLAKNTRDAQKTYFRTRSTEDLRISKDWERRLDKAVAMVLAPPDLFPEETPGPSPSS